MNFKKVALTACLAVGMTAAFAQDKGEKVEFRPHWFMQVQGGIGHTVGEAKFKDLISPTAALSAGYRFTPVWGLRGGFSGWQGKGSWVSPRENYKYNYAQLNADVIFDMANCFGGFNHKRFFNPYLLAGVGGNIAFNNDEAMAINASGRTLEYLWEDSKAFVAGRMGIGADFRICDAVAFNIEGNANVMSDHFNSKKAGNADWQLNILAGVSIRFGKGYTKKQVKEAKPYVPVTPAPVKKEEPKKEETKPVEAAPVKAEPMKTEVFFELNSDKLRESETGKVDALAAYLKNNADAKVVLTGYADVDTGNARINRDLSKRRAERIAKALAERGIAKDRITVDFKGDTVQPFSTAKENRVVIGVTK